MSGPGERRFRPALGLLEAGALLVVVLGVAYAVAPGAWARNAASAETAALDVLGAMADAEEAALRGGGTYLPLPELLARDPGLARRGLEPSPVAGVYAGPAYWFAVLLADEEGRPRRAATAPSPRGFVALAWPRRPGVDAVRALAALPGGVSWQHALENRGSGDPARPPVPRAVFPPPKAGVPQVPQPPPDWSALKRPKAR